jgi:hypothetical protein
MFQAMFTHKDPKIVKIQSSFQYLLRFLRFACLKAARKMLLKLTPGVNFINVLEAAFMRTDLECTKKDRKVSSFVSCFWDL